MNRFCMYVLSAAMAGGLFATVSCYKKGVYPPPPRN